MTPDEIKKKIADYLASHNKMTLATVTPDGRPLAHTVEYVSDGCTVYFGTLRATRKAQNILKTGHAAFAVDEDYADWTKIQGVQMEGAASVLSDPKELKQAGELYLGKFPAVASFPQNPDMIMVKVEPVAGFFLDYLKGFAHRDEVAF
ncbi:MAG: pyridoxamine 5'-phosphate oxidase family protein [Nitrospiraceae bacterium]|nr:pyridoxamine 5'-phosphate oxidase family protein [Nitrospiraceae bacterium]